MNRTFGCRAKGTDLKCNSVYIVDDDADVRDALTFFLTTAGFAARAFADPLLFMAEAETLDPGCVLLDVRMPGIDGFEVIDRLQIMRSPHLVAVMTGHGDIGTAVRAMKLGAVDFLEKPFEEETLLEILSRTFATLDNNALHRERRGDARARLATLTDREREVLVALVAGRANKVIAFELDISVRTVEMHRAAMMDRLRVKTFAGALRLALDGGLDLGPTVPALPGQRP